MCMQKMTQLWKGMKKSYTIEANNKIPDNCKYPFAYRSCSKSKANKDRRLSKVAELQNGAKECKGNAKS